MNHWMPFPPSMKPNCKIYEGVKGAVEDPFAISKLKFFRLLVGSCVF